MSFVEKHFMSYKQLFESTSEKMDLPPDVLKIAKRFKHANKKLYVVGGAVRDFLLGNEPKDWDLATDALPDETMRILRGHYELKEVGKAFGIVIASTPVGDIEIATFRKDMSKGRRPDSVEFTSIENDVKRRDLTVNAMFYDIDKEEIIDLVGGKDDLLKHKVVRTVGHPKERFEEDPLRKLRAIRFAEKLGHELQADVAEVLKSDNSLDEVSMDRIHNEYLNTLRSAKNTLHAIQTLDEFGFLQQVFPDMRVKSDKAAEKFPIATTALVLRDNEEIEKHLNQIKWKGKDISRIEFLHALGRIDDVNVLKKLEKKADFYYAEEVLSYAKAMKLDMSFVKALLAFKLSTKGDDVMDDGFEGPEVGKEIRRRETVLFNDFISKK